MELRHFNDSGVMPGGDLAAQQVVEGPVWKGECGCFFGIKAVVHVDGVACFEHSTVEDNFALIVDNPEFSSASVGEAKGLCF